MKLKGLLMKLKKLKIYKFLFVINFIILGIFFIHNATACSDIKFAKKDIFVEATKKFGSFFFANFNFSGKKICGRISRRAFFEDSLEISVFI